MGCKITIVSAFVNCIIYMLTKLTDSALVIPGVSRDCYVQPGDILIGAIVNIRNQAPGNVCGNTTTARSVAYAENIRYAVDLLNQNPNILPNITVGLVMLDTCRRDLGKLAAAMYFVPDEESMPPWDVMDCEDSLQHYRVAAVIGPSSSGDSVMTAPVLSMVDIPNFSTYATSDELSDKSRYEYFMRIAPPDRFQAEAILDILTTYNWTYFGMVYLEGSYGENGAKFIEKGADELGLCLAVSEMIYSSANDVDFQNIWNALINDGRLRAVVVFAGGSLMERFFQVQDEQYYGRFIWIGSDYMGFNEYGTAFDGAFVIHFLESYSDEYEEYAETLTPFNHPEDSWLKLAWETHYSCSWAVSPCYGLNCSDIQSCELYENQTMMPHTRYNVMYLDIVKTIGLGLDSLFRFECDHVFLDPAAINDCPLGQQFLESLKNVRFNGSYGEIHFDNAGDNVAKYLIRQYSAFVEGPGDIVGEWDQNTGDVTLYHDSINWTVYNAIRGSGIPDSVCSYPCPLRHYYIQKEMLCCWDCHECRNNEIIINSTSCHECPTNTWPDQYTATLCENIEPESMTWDMTTGKALWALNAACVFISVIVTAFVIHFRHKRIIKASSRELMAIILIGVFMAFLTVFVIISRPTSASCFVSQCGFTLSVATVYAPLLVKTNRVYRIFTAGKKGKERPMLISSRAQMFLALILIALQVILTIAMSIADPVSAQVRMPVATERYSELHCDLPLLSLGVLLGYNLALLLLCALFGFLTRKLPENFNEAWYIFVSVATTSFLWMVFLPTYFTTFYAVHQAALLATCLILNGLISLLCLFIPKIYAIYYINEDSIKFATTTGTAPTSLGQ